MQSNVPHHWACQHCLSTPDLNGGLIDILHSCNPKLLRHALSQLATLQSSLSPQCPLKSLNKTSYLLEHISSHSTVQIKVQEAMCHKGREAIAEECERGLVLGPHPQQP